MRGGSSRSVSSTSTSVRGVRRGHGARRSRTRSQSSRVCGGHSGRGVNEDEWKWNTTFSSDSSVSSPPVFSAEYGPSSEAQQCERPDESF